MTLKIAIIGCGAMGRNHAQAWQSREDAQVVAVFDAVAEARDAMAKEMSATAYDSFQGAIDHDGLDAVSICTPTPFHREVACYAAAQGRHILCEKPLAGSIEDADAMVEAADRHGIWLTVGHQYREWPRNQRIKQLYDDGALGSPLIARYEAVAEVRPKTAMHQRSMNQGPVLDMAAHWFDLMRYFTGAELVSVFASGNVFGRGKARLADLADDDFATDAAEVQARFDGGHVLSVGVIWGMPENFPGFGREQVCGSKGLVRAEGSNTEVVLGPDQREQVPPTGAERMPRINDLVRAIRTGNPPRVTGHDGREAVRGCLAALRSIETGEVVETSTLKVS